MDLRRPRHGAFPGERPAPSAPTVDPDIPGARCREWRRRRTFCPASGRTEPRDSRIAASLLRIVASEFYIIDSELRTAVRLIAGWRGPEHVFVTVASHLHEWAAKQNFGDTGAPRFLPQPVRLALEMSAHEEQEQRALEGELVELEREWRDAEEIAAIADNLLLPGSIPARVAALRNRR